MSELLTQFRGGLTGLFIGAPGTGKSTLLGSIGELLPPEEVLLLAPKPREINSFMYRRHGIHEAAEVFKDHRWRPSLGVYEADAFDRLSRRLLELYEDTKFRAVLLDPFTDVVALAAHELLRAEQAETPKDLRDSIGFYGALKHRLKNFTQDLVGLASPDLPQPKHVFVAVHAQRPVEEDIKGKATADAKGKGVEWEGDVLPMVEGGYRREIAGEFDLVGFTSVEYENVRVGNAFKRQESYVVQLNASPDRHAKAAIAPRLKTTKVANTLKAVLEAVVEAQDAA